MEETTLIESKKSYAIARIAIIGVIMIVSSILLRFIIPPTWVAWYKEVGKEIESRAILKNLIAPSQGFDFVISGLLYLGVIFTIYGTFQILAYKNVSLTVTNKRVFGTSSWGKRVDLPIDMISAVATAARGGIAVSSASGAIRFAGIKNNKEIHETISKLLMERQSKPAPAPTPAPEAAAAPARISAQELKELKELLDRGIITQEEFDAKKKQLLGL